MDQNIRMEAKEPPAPAYGVEQRRLLVEGRNKLERQGFAHVSGAKMAALAFEQPLGPLLAAAADLASDPAGDGQRVRGFRTGTLFAWTGEFRFDPPFPQACGAYVPYYQSAATNADAGGRERRFAPLPDSICHDPLFRGLTRAAFNLIPADYIERRLPIRVSWHLIRLKSDGRRICTPSPNTLHVDTEPFTAVILIDRENIAVNSARSYVATRPCAGLQPQDVAADDILAELTLAEPLETLIVDDARVSHSVTGALGAGGTPGYRTSLLIDFTGIGLIKTADPVL